jgi:hypothetical protein
MGFIKAKKLLRILALIMPLIIIVSGLSELQKTSAAGLGFNIAEIKLSPRQPEPNSIVRAEIIAYGPDEDRSYITWTINGTIIEQGLGKKTVEFKTGDIGSALVISASLVTEKEQEFKASKRLKIGKLDLLWQTNNYIPVFYKGKALPFPGSQIKITALPYGFGASENFIYKWTRGGKSQQGASGLGKNSFVFNFSPIDEVEEIGVQISDIDKTFTFGKKILIGSKDIEVQFYEEHPRKGPFYQKALDGRVELNQAEIAIRAEPYFLPKDELINARYNWTMNGQPLESLSKNTPNIIGLIAPSGNGQSLIELRIEDFMISRKLKLIY